MGSGTTRAGDLIRTQIRRLRVAAELSQEDFGRLVHYSGSMVSAVELGQRPLDLAFLTRADEVLGGGGLLTELWELAKRDGAPLWFRPWLEAERGATQLRFYEPNLIPGLLQTPGYAREVLRIEPGLNEAEVEARVTARMERQDILTRDHPPQVITVVDEAAIRRFGEGFDRVMAEQLLHLLACTERPDVSVHVVPAEVVLHIGLSGPFALARSTEDGWVGHLEHQLGGVVIDRSEHVDTLLAKWECVRNEALPRRQSIDLIKEVVKPWT